MPTALRPAVAAALGVVVVAAMATGACTTSKDSSANRVPTLADRGKAMTTAKPVRQDLTNKISLSGRVTLDPVFGIASPIAGQVRYLTLAKPTVTPTKPTRVANVWANGKATGVEVPAGAVLVGQLADDQASVVAGTPVVAAKQVGYGIVADIDGGQAYRITGSAATVQAQIKNGPGPFTCTMVGSITALPSGMAPKTPEAAKPSATGPRAMGDPTADASRDPGRDAGQGAAGSEATSLRLVCTAPADVKMISGAEVTVEVTTEKATGVLVLPVEAVAGSQGKGKVDVVGPDGARQTRDVELGLTDGKVIEIRSGLTGDETVAVPGPNLPKPDSTGDQAGRGGPR